MEALSDKLQPYKEVVGTVAAAVTIAQMFSGVFMCYDIYKANSTSKTSIVPFVGGFVVSALNLKYGYLLADDKMVLVNLVGLALNIIYLSVYYQYSSNKNEVWMKLGCGWLVTGGLIAYTQYEDPSLVEYRFGMILTAFMFLLISSPLFNLKTIIKNQSTEGLPFPMIFSGTIVCSMWLLYGIILKNQFLVMQNVVALALCASQLSLFVIYPSKSKGKEKTKLKTKKIN